MLIGSPLGSPRSSFTRWHWARRSLMSLLLRSVMASPTLLLSVCILLRAGGGVFVAAISILALVLPIGLSCSPTCRPTLHAARLAPGPGFCTSVYSLNTGDVYAQLTHRRDCFQPRPFLISLSTVKCGKSHPALLVCSLKAVFHISADFELQTNRISSEMLPSVLPVYSVDRSGTMSCPLGRSILDGPGLSSASGMTSPPLLDCLTTIEKSLLSKRLIGSGSWSISRSYIFSLPWCPFLKRPSFLHPRLIWLWLEQNWPLCFLLLVFIFVFILIFPECWTNAVLDSFVCS